MKISPVSASGRTLGAIEMGTDAPTPLPQVRSLKMMTNATPGRIDELPSDQALSIPDDGVDKAPAAPEETQPLSPQFAALAKQRRALQVKEREIADREKALLEKSPLQGDVIDKARLKSDPLGVLRDAGVTYDQLTEAVIADRDGFNPKIAELEAKIKALEAGVDKKLIDRDAQSEKAALAEMRVEATRLASQGDDFEVVRETGSIPDVMRLIETTYRKHGEVLDVREAMTLVENDLVVEGLKRANLKKLQSQLAPAQTMQPPPQQQRQMRTLTNRDTASVPLSRKARALAAFAGTLKK